MQYNPEDTDTRDQAGEIFQASGGILYVRKTLLKLKCNDAQARQMSRGQSMLEANINPISLQQEMVKSCRRQKSYADLIFSLYAILHTFSGAPGHISNTLEFLLLGNTETRS